MCVFHTFLSSDDNLLPNLILLFGFSYNSNVLGKKCIDFTENIYMGHIKTSVFTFNDRAFKVISQQLIYMQHCSNLTDFRKELDSKLTKMRIAHLKNSNTKQELTYIAKQTIPISQKNVHTCFKMIPSVSLLRL